MSMKEWHIIRRPPLLDGSKTPNITNWKPSWKPFSWILIREIRVLIMAWIPPYVIDNMRSITKKPKKVWWTDDNDDEEKTTFGNLKIISAIFSTIYWRNIFNLISKYKFLRKPVYYSSHCSWRHKQSSHVFIQMIITRFRNLKMKEDESNFEFNVIVWYFSNESFASRETLLEEKHVRKIPRSLHQQFSMKVACFEEAQDVNSMKLKLDAPMESLEKFEMKLQDTDQETKWSRASSSKFKS